MNRCVPLTLWLAACAAPLDGSFAEHVGSLGRKLDPGCSGSSYSTIQKAIDAASGGDVVEICGGTYRERLTIAGKRLTLRAKSGQQVVIDAHWGGRALQITHNANVTVDGMEFVNGSVGDIGGDLYCDSSALNLTNSRIAAGKASHGGGLGATNCTGNITDDLFENNDSTWVGGGAYVSGDGLHVLNDTFQQNHASGQGGALYLHGSSELSANHVEDNTSDDLGGGFYVDYGWGLVDGNTFLTNSAVNDGGGFYAYHGAPTVQNSTFEGNDVGDEGGALRLKLSAGSVLDNTFTDNHADWQGGAAKISHQATTVSGNVFDHNSTWGNGGALAFIESASDVTDNTYTNNSADKGGALYVAEGWDAVHVEDSTFDGNHAKSAGGHAYVELPNKTTRFRRVDFANGNAPVGGALYADGGSNVVMQAVSFDSNTASVEGGAVYLYQVTGELTNGVAWMNDAPSGAALAFDDVVSFDVDDTIIARNTGSAAVRLDTGVVPSVTYSDFYGNVGNFSGMNDVSTSHGNMRNAPNFAGGGQGHDFHLKSYSPCINSGDPDLKDVDGSRSDMGRYGGPQGW